MVELKAEKRGIIIPPATTDEVLLDEFFSLVASIAGRLTPEDVRLHNSDDSTSLEANP